MNLSALQTFLAIVETGSLVKASKRLNVTQSTVTARLKTLEDELGQTLIIRQKSGATLTAAGGRLKRYAETMTELWRQARQETALPNNVNSVCNIGCHPDLWPHLGQDLFNWIHQTQGDVAVSIWQAGQVELSSWQETGLIDIALTYWSNAQGNQTLHTLEPDRLILVSTEQNAPIKFNPGYVFVEAGEEFGREHAATYADADIAKLNFGSASLGLAHILEYGGSAYLPRRIAAPYLQTEQIYCLAKSPEFQRNVYMVVNDKAAMGGEWLETAIETVL
jgi:DNA-binding transcriptional LysR family regulator